MHLRWFLVVGLIAGWLAGKLTGFGIVGDILLGVVGAFFGGFLFRVVGFHAGGTIASIIVATVGAVILVLLARAVKGT